MPQALLTLLIQNRVKARNPKKMEDLKKITIEEWNKIPLSNIRNRFAHWRKKIAKIFELNGATLKNYHINEIKNEENEENEEDDEENEEDDKENENKLLKVVYDEKGIQKKKKKEIKLMRLKVKIKKMKISKEEKNY